MGIVKNLVMQLCNLNIIRLFKRYSIYTITLLFVCMIASYGQENSLIDKRINLKMNDTKIEEILNYIESIENIPLIYNKNEEAFQKKINVDISEANIGNLLNDIFKNSTIDYWIFRDSVVIISSISQDITISGRILNRENNEPVSYVAIQYKNSMSGTISNQVGEYEIKLKPELFNDSLVISSLGYKTISISIKNMILQKDFDIYLPSISYYFDEVQKISIATKSLQSINYAPAIVSIITHKEIKSMDSREVEELLRTIPGFELLRSYAGYYNVGVRGVKDTRTTSKILIMIDGVPFNQVFYGNYIDWGYNINIDAIKRIEIIRGPGSALYGRNAFSGVINFITKKGKSSEKVFLKTSIGTNNTKLISGYTSFNKNKLNAFISARRLYTDVINDQLEDELGNLAKWSIFCDNLWTNSTISYGKFMFTGMYLNLKSGGTFKESYAYNEIGNYSLSYSNDINSNLKYNIKAFGHNSSYKEDIEYMKPGISPDYEKGIYFTAFSREYIYGLETEIKYKLTSNNHLLFGVQADAHGVKDVILTSNVNMVTFEPLSGIGRENQVLYEPGWFENDQHHYNNVAVLFQDIWKPIEKTEITIGGRLDIDSEIGSVFNPRLGLVFGPMRNNTVKILYGRAYRAPSPSEQYALLGYAIGNKDLKPEVINTFEIALINHKKRINQSVNIFFNKLTDMIYAARLVVIDPNNKYYNIGKNISTGIEYENRLKIDERINSFFNYSYTYSKNTESINGYDTTYNHPDVAPHKINAGINYSFLKNYKLNVNMFYRSKMGKFKIIGTNKEVQNEIGNYAILNSTFQINNLIKNVKFTISMYNILNTKYYSQDNQHLYQPAQPGRQIIGSILFSIK